ncbi:MAG TPA: hypothetical protein VN934_06615 [Candidatus Tumulicola sp.]|nr:hypothetical protein [Candidatus Tumulicola sp.]
MSDQSQTPTPAIRAPVPVPTPEPGAPQHTPAPPQQAGPTQGIGHLLSNLASIIPGFAGYKAIEDRRNSDKQLRATIGERLTAINGRLSGVVDALTRQGDLDALALIDQSGRRLERLIDRMRFADYGYSAVFDRVQLGEPELDRLYQYDLGIMQDLGSFDAAASEIESSASDSAKLGAALNKLDALTAEFDRRFEARKHLFDGLPTV